MHENLTTETANPDSADLDRLSSLELVSLINAEDAKIAAAVAEQIAVIAAAVDLIAEKLADGGRLIYLGAGTSGRLGVRWCFRRIVQSSWFTSRCSKNYKLWNAGRPRPAWITERVKPER
jgi:hypothetical protein